MLIVSKIDALIYKTLLKSHMAIIGMLSKAIIRGETELTHLTLFGATKSMKLLINYSII